MSTPTTDIDYNAASREIQVKLKIYFNEEPLEVTRADYLMSATLLEEAQSDSQTILGQVSSNELGFDLYNDTKIFTPTNADGPYYNKIKKNVKVEAFGRAVNGDTEWDELGTYYVKEWSTTASGMVASVTANDKLYDVFDAPVPVYYVTRDVSVKGFYEQYFDSLDIDVSVDASIDTVLPYAYINGNNKEFLNDLSNGALALCYSNRQDGVSVINRVATHDLRATLTDDDQIIDIATAQSIDTGYDGASVTCNSPQESVDTQLIAIKDQAVASGTSALSSINVTSTPLVRIDYAYVSGSSTVRVDGMTATPEAVSFTLVNEETTEQSVDITMHGTYVEVISSVEADTGSNLLELDSRYVQTQNQCSAALAYLRNAASITSPTLKVETRGNFKLLIGDKVRIQSTRYKTDFVGIIIRNSYRYDGGLKCTLTLMDAKLFEEVM